MPSFRKKYNDVVTAIVTEAVVAERIEVKDGRIIPPFYYSNNAVWDTGAEVTIISRQIVEDLGLKPFNKAIIMGVDGEHESETYKIQLCLPTLDVVKELEAYCGENLAYDVVIGMDVISKTDFLITNKDNTVFSFRYPSEGGVTLKMLLKKSTFFD